MNKKEIQTLILKLKEKEDIRLKVSKTEEARIRDHIRRASAYGYKFCFHHLYDGKYYLEKIEEGDKDKYSKIIRE